MSTNYLIMNSVNKKEIEKFSKIAEEWWNPVGKFKPLHKFNPIRIKYIKDHIVDHFKLANKKKPLEKINILDIGCGGGLLSEPMQRLGGNVTGIDASIKNIKIAKLHSRKNNFDYVGENFAYEARSIHYNHKKRAKGIYGTASQIDLKELKEEGIEAQMIPWIKDRNN